LAQRSTPEYGLPLAAGGAEVTEPPAVVELPPVAVVLVAVVELGPAAVEEGSAVPGWHWE